MKLLVEVNKQGEYYYVLAQHWDQKGLQYQDTLTVRGDKGLVLEDLQEHWDDWITGLNFSWGEENPALPQSD